MGGRVLLEPADPQEAYEQDQDEKQEASKDNDTDVEAFHPWRMPRTNGIAFVLSCRAAAHGTPMGLGDRVVKCHPMVPTAWPLNRA